MTAFHHEISEQLQVIPAQIVVLRHKRLKYKCQACACGVKIAPVVDQAIEKCLAAPGLLAHVAVAKFDDHCAPRTLFVMWQTAVFYKR